MTQAFIKNYSSVSTYRTVFRTEQNRTKQKFINLSIRSCSSHIIHIEHENVACVKCHESDTCHHENKPI